MQAAMADTVASGGACVQKIGDNPEYGALKSKSIFTTDPQFPLQMLNDKTSPTKREISLLYRVYGDIQDCRKIILDGVGKIHPLILLTLIEEYAESDKLWVQATGGGLTWGRFNEGRKTVIAEARQKLIQVSMQIGSELKNEHQTEIAQRQQAVAAMGDALTAWSNQQQQIAMQQQAINAANRPRIINCDRFGGSVSCTSN